MTDLNPQTTSVPRLKGRYALSRKSNKLANLEELVARPVSTVMCSLRKIAAAKQATCRYCQYDICWRRNTDRI
jgi:hypothetical protein